MLKQRNIQLSDSTIRTALYTLFVFSGFSGLIYESIWTHYLKLFLGHAAYAQTLVLIIFMGGMALGAWGVGRISERIPHLIYGYAIVEALIGILGLVFHIVFVGVTDFSYSTVIPRLNSVLLLSLYKWGLAALFILPQTILLGATFPLMSAGLIRIFPEKSGRTLAVLYFSNSIGAVAGVLVSGYLLIGFFGLPGTIMTAGLINLLIAIAIWLICRNEGRGRVTVSDQGQGLREMALSNKIFIAFLLCSCLTGMASFMYEIGWIRMLSLVLGSSTHAFELMLSAFILGLALGGYWIKRSIDSLVNPVKTLGIIQVVMGGFALLTLILYGQTFNLMSYLLSALSRTYQGYFLFNIFSQGIALLVMLPAAICAGMTLPVITYYLISNGYGEGAIGKTYAVNTIGAIIGVLLGVQLVMPVLGLKNVIIIGASVDVLTGLGLLWYAGPEFSKKSWSFVTIILAGFFVFSIFGVQFDANKMASGVFRTGLSKKPGTVIFHKDGKTASVDMVWYPEQEKLIIQTNGKPDGSIGMGRNPTQDEPTQMLIGALAWGMYDKARTVATIGIGTGMSANTLLLVDSIQSVDTIEIEPFMVEGARRFGDKVSNVFKDQRSRIYIEDAKTFFTNHKKKYDLIISEPSNPWVSGTAGLFSREFYKLIRNYINEDGLLIQWIQVYEISTPLVASVIKSLSECFEDYDIYFTLDGNLYIFAGRNVSNKKPSEKMFEIPKLKAELARIGIFNTRDLYLRHLGNKKMLDPLFQSYAISPNSDFFPILDLNAVRDRFIVASAMEVIRLRTIAAPLTEVLSGEPIPNTDISTAQADPLDASLNARQAVAIYQYFSAFKGNEEAPQALLNANSLQIVRNIRSIHDQCQLDQFKEGWLPFLHALSGKTIPYLSPKQMEVIWEDIESSRCYTRLPDLIRDWVGLYKSVSSRDFVRALQYSTKLIPEGAIKASLENNYLIMVAMLSNMVLKNDKGSMDLLNRYENKVAPPIEIRLLATIASNRKE